MPDIGDVAVFGLDGAVLPPNPFDDVQTEAALLPSHPICPAAWAVAVLPLPHPTLSLEEMLAVPLLFPHPRSAEVDEDAVPVAPPAKYAVPDWADATVCEPLTKFTPVPPPVS